MLRELGSSPDRVTITGGLHDGATGVVVARVDDGELLTIKVRLDETGEEIGFTTTDTLGSSKETAMGNLVREFGS